MRRPVSWACAVAVAVLLAGCDAPGARPPAADVAPADGTPDGVVRLDDEQAWQWSHSCALCHVTGNGGAPRVGDAQAWLPRLQQGRAALLEHAIRGFNNMPPLGYCMSCGRDDLVALIDFMLPPAPPGETR